MHKNPLSVRTRQSRWHLGTEPVEGTFNKAIDLYIVINICANLWATALSLSLIIYIFKFPLTQLYRTFSKPWVVLKWLLGQENLSLDTGIRGFNYHPLGVWNNKWTCSLRGEASRYSEQEITALQEGSYFCMPFAMCVRVVFKRAQTLLDTLCSQHPELCLTLLSELVFSSFQETECLQHIRHTEWQRRLCTQYWERAECKMSRRRYYSTITGWPDTLADKVYCGFISIFNLLSLSFEHFKLTGTMFTESEISIFSKTAHISSGINIKYKYF